MPNIEFISDQFEFDDKDLLGEMHPLKFQTLSEYQERDEKLMKKLADDSRYTLTSFHGGENN